VAAGERVVRVPPHRMGASRKGERERGKSDQIDALAIARAVVRDGIERFPVAYLDEAAMGIRLLLDHRNELVAGTMPSRRRASTDGTRPKMACRGSSARGRVSSVRSATCATGPGIPRAAADLLESCVYVTRAPKKFPQFAGKHGGRLTRT
jgi:hypothetical protein